MNKRLDKRADYYLLNHGFDTNGNKRKGGKPKFIRTPKQEARKRERKILSDSKDLIKERKESDLSDMELEIATFLSRNGVHFIREYFMPGLYNPETRKPLFFDFYLPKYNLVIEYDGIQHFKSSNKYKLNTQKAKDCIKDRFCSRKKIFILRIPYWKKNRFEYLILERIDQITRV